MSKKEKSSKSKSKTNKGEINSPFDVLRNILYKFPKLKEEDIEKYYSPFLINRMMMALSTTTMKANEINIRVDNLPPDLIKKASYMYYYTVTTHRDKQHKYVKDVDDSEAYKKRIENIATYHGFSLRKAREVESLISKDEYDTILAYFEYGGR